MYVPQKAQTKLRVLTMPHASATSASEGLDLQESLDDTDAQGALRRYRTTARRRFLVIRWYQGKRTCESTVVVFATAKTHRRIASTTCDVMQRIGTFRRRLRDFSSRSLILQHRDTCVVRIYQKEPAMTELRWFHLSVNHRTRCLISGRLCYNVMWIGKMAI